MGLKSEKLIDVKYESWIGGARVSVQGVKSLGGHFACLNFMK